MVARALRRRWATTRRGRRRATSTTRRSRSGWRSSESYRRPYGFSGGADARRDATSSKRGVSPRRTEPPRPSSVAPAPTNVTWGAHADVVWRLAPRVEIVPGIRVDVYESSRAQVPGSTKEANTRVPAVDPRLAARVTLTPSVAWLSTLGLSHQYPALRVGSVPAAVLTGSGFPLGESRLQTVAQASQGSRSRCPRRSL